MASVVNHGSDMLARVVSRHLVTASDSSIKDHVLDVSNIDLLHGAFPVSLVCIYPKPPTGSPDAVVAAFAAGLPSFLNHYFPFTGRIVTNPLSGLPEVHCKNQGAELVVGEAGVALASLDFGSMDLSVGKIPMPYGEDVALSVQVVSFACGGFSVAWGTNHLLVDGYALCMLVSAWSELARTGSLAAGSRPVHDRSVFFPRATLSSTCSSSSRAAGFKPFGPDPDRPVIGLQTSDGGRCVQRLYYLEARGISRLREMASRDDGERATRVQAVSAYMWKAFAAAVVGVAAADTRCRMGWWVDGRRRLTAPEHRRAAKRNYVGNVAIFAQGEAGVEAIQRKPLPEVASMAREAISGGARAYGDRFQEIVDQVEQRKASATSLAASNVGQSVPTMAVSSFASFPLETDFGFGRAAMAMPTSRGRGLCSGFVQLVARPGGDGSWIVSARVWPKLAAALESDVERIFRPVTAEYLGLMPQPFTKAGNAEDDGSPLSRL